MSIMHRKFIYFITFIIMLSNIIPVIGPCIIANAIGNSQERFKHSYGLKNISIIICLIIGTLIFFIVIGFFIFFAVEFTKLIYFLNIIRIWFLIHMFLILIFYFIGKNNYKMKILKEKK